MITECEVSFSNHQSDMLYNQQLYWKTFDDVFKDILKMIEEKYHYCYNFHRKIYYLYDEEISVTAI